jgi:hypothetical protein
MEFNVEKFNRQFATKQFDKVESVLKGNFYKIKKLSQLDRTLILHTLGVFNQTEVKHPTTDFQENFNKINFENQCKAMEDFILKSVVEPKITKQREDGAICIDDIPQKDYNNLCLAITKLSLPTQERKEKLPPSSKKRSSTRRNGKKI